MATIRWIQPTECPEAEPCPADYWRIYSQESGGPPVIDHIFATPDAEGIHTWEGALPDGWYTMTAVNAAGESDHSNPKFVPEPGFVLGLTCCLLLLAVLNRWRRHA